MTLAEVQARTAELDSRLMALGSTGRTGGVLGMGTAAPGPATPTPTAATGTGTGTGPTFAAAMQSALLRTQAQAAGPSTTAGSGAGGQTSTGPTTGADIVDTARQQLGVRYVWGGSSLADGGFDCSGLVQWTYAKYGIHLPRVAGDQSRAGREVSPTEAQPGDLVYFAPQAPRPEHIGIYAGKGMWVVAPKTGDVVKVQKVDLDRASTIRRVLPDSSNSGLTPAAYAPSADWASALPAAGRPFAPLIAQAADAAGVDPRLLSALAWTESGFDPSARSPAGAVGLVQLMPRTAQGLGVDDPTDPAQSLSGGARYLRQQLDAFAGRADLALAAYNAGPTAVRRAGGLPPYAETQHYVATVLDHLRALGGST